MEEENSKQNKIMRVLTGIIISIISLCAVFLGSVPLYILFCIVIFLCCREFVYILRHKGFHPSLHIIVFSSFLFITLTFFKLYELTAFVLAVSVMASFLIVLFKGRQPYIVNVATTMLGSLYCGCLPSYLIVMRQIGEETPGLISLVPSDGLFLLVFVIVGVAFGDIGAYYFGRKFGRHKLAEVISPKKTIEGSVAGALCTVFVCMFGVFYTNLTFVQTVVAGLIITISAQLGDLSESLIKRDAGVKDSSKILPGHGGMLDRFDGYIFAIPAAYYYFTYFCFGENILIDFFDYLKGALNAYF